VIGRYVIEKNLESAEKIVYEVNNRLSYCALSALPLKETSWRETSHMLKRRSLATAKQEDIFQVNWRWRLLTPANLYKFVCW
jgi:hypothetical protein